MKRVIKSARELSRGVFWVIDDELLAFPFVEGDTIGVAKSGNTYNHKMLWDDIKPRGCNKPYNYYPRGRVELKNDGSAVIYMNPNIDESIISDIRREFGIKNTPKIVYDNSVHYRCYLDDGWRSDR